MLDAPEELYSDDEKSILGDTINQEILINEQNTQTDNQQMQNAKIGVTLEQLEALFDRKLNSIKETWLSELKTTVETVIINEINKVKQELSKTTTAISQKQDQINKEIEKLNKIIINLKKENMQLQTEIQKINKNIEINKNALPTGKCCEGSRDKKIILYGLEENRWEESGELYERVVCMFQDILNINIQGYVENMKRIGKKGFRRPLEIEFMSKNLTRQLLQHRKYFKNTGLAVSEVLGEESLQKRKKLIETLIKARRDGHRANIIDDKLIINGRHYNPEPLDDNIINRTTTNAETQILDATETSPPNTTISADFFRPQY